MYFVVLRDDDALHFLNAISPAFTSSMTLAKYAVAPLLGKIGGAWNAVSVPEAGDPGVGPYRGSGL